MGGRWLSVLAVCLAIIALLISILLPVLMQR